MQTSALDYELPPDRIAQHPLPDRSASRLLVVDRRSSELRHCHFRDLPEILASGDLLVRNDSRVLPSRLEAQRATGGRVELLLVQEIAPERWLAIVKPASRLRRGEQIHLARGPSVTIGDRVGTAGMVEVTAEGLTRHMQEHGAVPLPPYIRRRPDSEDRERYQTIYGVHPGSVAAPTAGLHFDERLLRQLDERGIECANVTLHVGPGTFQPIRSDALEQHRMHAEQYAVPATTVDAVSAAVARGARVLAVGTTSVRALEAASASGALTPGSGSTEIYITPGYRFRVVSSLLTNFHQPRSTLLALVAGFVGPDSLLAAYRAALDNEYRFLSYGDAMLIL